MTRFLQISRSAKGSLTLRDQLLQAACFQPHLCPWTDALSFMTQRSFIFPHFPGTSEPLKNNHAFINFDKWCFLLSSPKRNDAKRTRICNQSVKKSPFYPQRPFCSPKRLPYLVFHIAPFLAAVARPAAGPRRLLVLGNLLIKSADWKTPGTRASSITH